MYESMLNLLFFVLFVCFLALILVSIASLDLKVPNVSCEKEEVMSFDVMKQATRGRACSTEKQMVTCSGLSSFVAYLSGLEKPLLAWCKRTAIKLQCNISAASSTNKLLDLWNVFLEYYKIEQRKALLAGWHFFKKTNLNASDVNQDTAWPVRNACAKPYHSGSSIHGELFRHC